MSSYSHEQRKFADTGLQLRLPVDLVPPTQYSRFTNALPVIEGQIRTRDGLILIGSPIEVVFFTQLVSVDATGNGIILNTLYPHGATVGQVIQVNVLYVDPNDTPHTAGLGISSQTVTSVFSSTSIGISPGIATNLGAAGTVKVFGQLTLPSVQTTLINTPVENIFRLNQAVAALASDHIVTINGRVFRQQLPAGSFQELVGTRAPAAPVPTQQTGFSGRPMSIIEFRFTLDTASWAIFADQNKMYKYRPGLNEDSLEFAPLGNAPPTAAALANAGAAGNLNSSGGTGYDWRYTWVDGYALTESNPSPISQTSGNTTVHPTSHSGFASSNTSGSAAFSLTSPPAGGTNAGSSNAGWNSFTIPAGVITGQTLKVTLSATGNGSGGSGGGFGQVSVDYSYDAGSTWHSLYQHSMGIGSGQFPSFTDPSQPYTVSIPTSVSPANVRVRANVQLSVNGPPTMFGQPCSGNIQLSVSAIDMIVAFQSAVTVLNLTNQIGVVCVQPSPYPQHKYINLYRRGGSLPDNWRLVGQFQQSALAAGPCVSGAVEIDDNVSDTTLSTAAILQLDNDQPVTSVTVKNQPLSFIWGPVGLDARVLGCGDPARPESVYFSKPGNADAWPPQNFVEVSSPGTPIIAGCVFNTRTFAFSRESIYELVEGLGTGTTFTPFRTPSAHGVYAPQAFAIGPAMFFVSKDGIYMSIGDRETSIVENDIKPLFPTYDTPGESVHGYEAVDMSQPDNMRLRYHNDELYFAYVGLDTGTRQLLVYDLLKKRWRAARYTNGISELYSEPATVSSLLMGTTPGQVWQAGGPVDPSALDALENAIIVSNGGVSSASAAYFRVVRFDRTFPASISYEVNAVMDATHVVLVTFPAGEPDTTAWRVYYGPTAGGESQYQEFTEAGLPANRTVTISTAGTAGTLPTANADNTIHGLIRTGANDQGVPLNQKQYGNVLFDLDPGGSPPGAPVSITPYINGEVANRPPLVISGVGRQQVPLDLSDYFAFNTEYEIAWSRSPIAGGFADPQFFQYDTLYFLEPVQVTHWQAQPTSFEFPGFSHCRDAYIAIRSTSPVLLTMTFDTGTGTEVTQTYTIPSTGGARLKQYIQFNSNKGLLYRFALDSIPDPGTGALSSFRVYEPDIEFRVKPWLGVLGYSVQRVLGGEANA